MARTDDLTKLILEHDSQVDSVNQAITQLNQQFSSLGVKLNAIIANSDYEASTSAAEKQIIADNLADITPIAIVFEKII
jgi:hypothetical protein